MSFRGGVQFKIGDGLVEFREVIEALFWICRHHLWISDLRNLIEFLRGKALILKRKKMEA